MIAQLLLGSIFRSPTTHVSALQNNEEHAYGNVDIDIVKNIDMVI